MLKVGIVIKEGIVQESFVSGGNNNVELYLIDWDNINCGEKSLIKGEEIQHISNKRFKEMIEEANEAIKENKDEL